MAITTDAGRGRKKLDDGQRGHGGGAVDTGLPLQSPDAQGSERGATVRDDAGNFPADTPVRNDAGGSASGSEWQNSFEAVFGNSRGLRTGGVGDRSEHHRVEAPRVPDTRPAQPPQLPDVSDRYREPLEEADTEAAGDGVCNGDAVLEAENNYNKLAKLRGKALDILGETMDLPTPPEADPNYARIVSTKKDAAVNVVNASLKADENCFRQRRNDALDRLYAAVAAEVVADGRKLIDVTLQ